MLELLLVTVIVGAIAALAVPRFSNVQERTRYTATWAQFGRFEAALNLYRAQWQDYPPDAWYAATPNGMSSYVSPSAWARESPVGGSWDWNHVIKDTGEANDFWKDLGPNVSLMHLAPFPPIMGTRFDILDARFDDNSQTTGKLRRWHTRFLAMPVEP
jgi:hypothetical protein